MSKDTRKLVPLKNHPGIYKICQVKEGKEIETGRFLACRRFNKFGRFVREKGVFRNLVDAKNFRYSGVEYRKFPVRSEWAGTFQNQPKVMEEKPVFKFQDLVSEWKAFHYLTIEESTQLLYERKLPGLDFLNQFSLDEINVEAIDQLVRFWVKEFPKTGQRNSFEKELKLLTVILNFYRTRKNGSYVIPIDKRHYEAATVVRKAKGEVQVLDEKDLMRFLDALKLQRAEYLFPLAACQFGLSLRIGEACGLSRESIDLERREARIYQTVIWNDRTWEASIKPYPKNNHVRYLAIPDFLVEILRAWMAKMDPKSDLLFRDNGELLNRKTIATAYNRSLKNLGISHVSGTHMMRKTSATCANEATGDFFAVSKQLDHASPEVTQRYVRPVSSQKRKVADALNNVFQMTLNSKTA